MSEYISEFDVSALSSFYQKKRDCYEQLQDFIENGKIGTICALYGLRRTGKTVLMAQMAQELYEKGVPYLALSCDIGATMSELNVILKDAWKRGIKHVFIDEITYVSDFQTHAARLANVYAAQGMRIVIAGTDSLGIALAEADALYDRIHKIHTTYIPYGEYKRLLGKDIDDYIAYGGTLTDSPYKPEQNPQQYLNSAIVNNIIHSLERNESLPGYPQKLTDLYESDEVASTLNKMIGLMNQKLALRSIRKEFSCGPLKLTLKNIDNEVVNGVASSELRGFFFSDAIDVDKVTDYVREDLHIKQNDELKTNLSEYHLSVLKGYLTNLDLLLTGDSYVSRKLMIKEKDDGPDLEIILQPGMVYAHAEALVSRLQQNDAWRLLIGANDIKEFISRADRAVRGSILENAVLANTILNYRNNEHLYISKLSVNRNADWIEADLSSKMQTHEFDMIMLDEHNQESYVFEVKYSQNMEHSHLKHLTHDGFAEYVKKHFGQIVGRYLIYNGPSGVYGDVNLVNVDDFFDAIYKHKDNWKDAIAQINEVCFEQSRVITADLLKQNITDIAKDFDGFVVVEDIIELSKEKKQEQDYNKQIKGLSDKSKIKKNNNENDSRDDNS